MADLLELAAAFDANGNSHYFPCCTGLHLCGSTIDDEQPYTAANFPARDYAGAREMFAAAKAAAECCGDEADFCCDLMIGGDHVDDFWTNRQLWPALAAAVARLTPPAQVVGREG